MLRNRKLGSEASGEVWKSVGLRPGREHHRFDVFFSALYCVQEKCKDCTFSDVAEFSTHRGMPRNIDSYCPNQLRYC